MANRVTHEFNNILSNFKAVSDYYSKRYLLNSVSIPAVLAQSNNINITDIDMYYRIAGYEFYEENEHNFKIVSDMADILLGSIGANNIPLVFSVYGTEDSVRVFYGTNHSQAHKLKNALSGNMFAFDIINEWINPNELSIVQTYNGFISGISNLDTGAIDIIINSLQRKHYLLNIVALPVAHCFVADEIDKINSHLDDLQKVSRTELTIGTSRARHFDRDNHDILEAIELLETEKQRLQRGLVKGMWKVAIHISSPDVHTYNEVASTVTSALRKNSKNETETLLSIVFSASFPIVKKSVWSLPAAFMGERDLGGLYSSTLLNLADLNTASSLITLPIYPHAGYSVKHLGASSTSTGAFNRYAPRIEATDAFELGSLPDGSKYMLPISVFRQHAFITGATQYGKSTTIQQMLIAAYKKGYSFVVLEAAKKDYWKLTKVEGMKNIPVYSTGMDAKNLFINPFQPEENTRLEFHIQSLINALLSMFDQTDPLPQIITNLVYTCYEKKGLDTRRRVTSHDNREYPILSDILDNLDECVANIGYSESGDTRDDMKGAVRVRISSLIRQVGDLFNSQQNISIKDLFSTSAIIELDDFDEVTKPFIASILAIKTNEYSKQCNEENKLHRLLVIEEAHHIIPNPNLPTASANSMRCSNYFSNMLAEVSAYGTGIIVVDQRASTISQAAIANTGVKIVHNIRQGDDIDAISRSMGLKNYEATLLNQFNIGEAIVAIPQSSEICRVKISNKKELSADYHLGCLFCNEKHCRDWSSMVTAHDTDEINKNGATAQSLKQMVDDLESEYLLKLSSDEKICLAGYLCSAYKKNDIAVRQQLFDYNETLLLGRDEENGR